MTGLTPPDIVKRHIRLEQPSLLSTKALRQRSEQRNAESPEREHPEEDAHPSRDDNEDIWRHGMRGEVSVVSGTGACDANEYDYCEAGCTDEHEETRTDVDCWPALFEEHTDDMRHVDYAHDPAVALEADACDHDGEALMGWLAFRDRGCDCTREHGMEDCEQDAWVAADGWILGELAHDYEHDRR